MTGFYKVSDGTIVKYCCETSLSKCVSAMFSNTINSLTISQVTSEEYFDKKAEEWMKDHRIVMVNDMYTKRGEKVICVELLSSDEEDATCHYVIEKNNKKVLIFTTQRKIIEGDI